MRNGWLTTTVGAVAAINSESVRDAESDRIVRYIDLSAVSAGRGIDTTAVAMTPVKDAPGRARRVVREGDVLVATVRPYLRGFAVVPKDLDGEVASTGFAVLRAQSEKVLPGYLWATVTTDKFVDGLMARATGSNYPAVRPGDVADQPIYLPPLAEQRRIVDLLGALDLVADRTQGEVVSASTTLEAVGRAVCADLASAPTVALAHIADVVGGLTKDAKRDADPNLVDVPYLRVANVQRGWLDLSEMAVIKAPPSKVASLRLRGGDVLFNEGGDRDKLGRGWVWEGQLDPCIHQNHVLRARVTDAEFDPWFISIWGNGPFGRVWFEENGSQTTNLASVSLSTLRRFPVPAIPIVDQHKIATEHLAIREVSRAATAVRQRALAARAALVTDLLSGDFELPASYDRFLDGAA